MQTFNQTIPHSFTRLLYFGISYGDLIEVLETTEDEISWARSMGSRAEQYEIAANRASEDGHWASVVEYLRHAIDYFHYAQFKLSTSVDYKESFQERCRSNYLWLSQLLRPRALRLNIPFHNGLVLPGYLRVSHKNAPCVILINGLDSAKEVELHYFSEVFLRRGLTTFTFDGPGQGEGLPKGSLHDFEGALSAVLDFLSRPPVNLQSPVGVFGVSFGGYLACRAAAADKRIAGCVSLGGFFDNRIFQKLPSQAEKAIKCAFHIPEKEDLRSVAHEVSLAPLSGRMERPLFIIHGQNDHLVDLEHIEAIRNWATGETRVWIMNRAEHVCTNRFGECLPVIGDWLQEVLYKTN